MAKHRVPPLARIRLARSLPRLLAWPLLVIATGAMAAASWLVGSFGAGAGGVVFAALGGILVVVGLVAAVVLFSVRLEVQEAAVRLSWLGGERIYPLERGPVTRVRLRGPEASRLRPRFGMFGWALGSARLRDEEEIHVVRLARTATAILVPTEHGRLAIAAADEEQLLDALSRAARARQRLEEIAMPAPAPPRERPEPPAAPALPGPVVDVEPRVLTGIERALLEQRLAEERAAAEAAEEEERRLAAGMAGADGPETGEAIPAIEGTAAAGEAPALTRAPSRRRILGRPRPAVAFVLLPLVGAGVAWGIGVASGSYPDPASDAGRLTALALVLAGPATSVGAIMALAWWPRLVGVVVSGGLAASAFIGRGLLG